MATFSLGVLCEPLSKQLPELPAETADRLQKHADAAFTLSLAGYLTPAQKDRLLNAIAKNIRRACEQ